jgi:DNA-binding NarL/FixJ family response regulator
MATPGSARRPTGVILIEPHTMLRAALRHLLRGIPDLELVGEAGSPAEGLDIIRSQSPDPRTVVVVSVPSNDSVEPFELVRTIRDELPATPIVVTAGRGDKATISRALLVGADSFVPQTRGVSALLDAIRRTADGEMVISRSERAAGDEDGDRSARQERSVLTRRELQVLRVAAEGLTARQIARELGVHERTASTHLGHIYRKLGVSNRVAALAAASRSGLLDDARRRGVSHGLTA